ncbi:hypothetical protein IC582_016847 [Cucumis melo]
MRGETEEEFSTRLVTNLEDEYDVLLPSLPEPVMGAGGVILPPATYFEKVRSLHYEILKLVKTCIGKTFLVFLLLHIFVLCKTE